MSFILNIDTSVQTSSICLAKDDRSLGLKINPSQKDSAAWLHMAIEELLRENSIRLHQLDAIAVSEGPGSYTGLRVGMATAKGLCYSLSKPLITINTLKMMAFGAREEETELLCPMIDARRMEVFAAVYNKDLSIVQPAGNFILNDQSFHQLLEKHSICFFGNGSEKFRQIVKHGNAFFKSVDISALSMIFLSNEKFVKQDFADLAYSQPFYGKDFHSSIK